MSLPPSSSASGSSTLYNQFALLPPPPRRILSRTPEDVRCRLPDFTLSDDPVAAVREWARQEFFVNLDPGWVHVYVGTGCIGALILIAGFILLLRIYAKTFWIARFPRRTYGRVIVPNSLLGWTLGCGAFGTVLLAVYWKLYAYFRLGRWPGSFPLWIVTAWYPLYLAAHVAAWGLFYAVPSDLTEGRLLQGRSGILRRLSHPAIINVLGICLPIIAAITVAIPLAFAQKRYSEALRMYGEWLQRYEGQETLSEEMLIDAQRFWYKLVDAFHIIGGIFFAWTSWGVQDLSAYAFVSGRLLLTLWKQIRAENPNENAWGVVTTIARRPGNDGPGQSGPEETAEQERDANERSGDDTLEANLIKSPSDLNSQRRQSDAQSPATADLERGSERNASSLAAAATTNSPISAQATPKIGAANARSRIVHHRIERSKEAAGRRRKRHHLYSVFNHVLLQAASILTATMCYCALSLWTAVVMSGAHENPYNQYSSILTAELIISVYLGIIFGGLTLLAIFKHTYEPVLHFGQISTRFGHGSGSGSGSGEGAKAKRRRSGGASAAHDAAGGGGNKGIALFKLGGGGGGSGRRGSQQLHHQPSGPAVTTFFESETLQPTATMGNVRLAPTDEEEALRRSLSRSGTNISNSPLLEELKEEQPTNDSELEVHLPLPQSRSSSRLA
ncbi:hypothetical protein IE81DRAFT_326268 [Ceraceosorus guamensis]|uniref:Uncharacterized protein n=1 Tax=Ceraceosorus guamensis TaxID=1522189 RepID=A0A316VPY6_9BASI|nr:hypothetical protein IE81DRAFT_326268 [Ceraceosorus guamensis]PWN39709.1 hypothetical protein IE81DRAFT_326268 [Ceraceosorus guamensis]